jgi:hypothetical protein
MLRLGPRSRAALAVAGLTAFALAYAATPLVAGEDVTPLAIDSPVLLTLKPAPAPSIAVAAVVAIAPRRDPFAGIPEAHDANPVPNAAPGAGQPAAIPTLPPLPSLPALLGAIGVLPANAGAGLGPPSEPVRVTAVITGTHPSAIVEDRNGTRIVTLGDLVGDDHVDAIDAAGVHVAHGTVYPVSPAGQPTPLPPVWTLPMPARPVAARPLPTNPASSPQPIPSGGLP